MLGDAAADETAPRPLRASLREAVAATGGTEVKTIGDALMVVVPGRGRRARGRRRDAARGRAAQPPAVEGHRLEMRVGISAGDATFEDGDWFGTPVVEASRLCAAATGGQILVSDLVRALAGSRSEFESIRSAAAS